MPTTNNPVSENTMFDIKRGTGDKGVKILFLGDQPAGRVRVRSSTGSKNCTSSCDSASAAYTQILKQGRKGTLTIKPYERNPVKANEVDRD